MPSKSLSGSVESVNNGVSRRCGRSARKARVRPVLLPSPPTQQTANGNKDDFGGLTNFAMIALSACRRSITSAGLRHCNDPRIVYAGSSETKRRKVLEQHISSTIFNTCEEDRHTFVVCAIDFSSYELTGIVTCFGSGAKVVHSLASYTRHRR